MAELSKEDRELLAAIDRTREQTRGPEGVNIEELVSEGLRRKWDDEDRLEAIERSARETSGIPGVDVREAVSAATIDYWEQRDRESWKKVEDQMNWFDEKRDQVWNLVRRNRSEVIGGLLFLLGLVAYLYFS